MTGLAKIVLVEDEAFQREVIAECLAQHGLRPTALSCGAELKRLAQHAMPDVGVGREPERSRNSVAAGEGGGRSDLYQRRAYLDFGGNDRRDRSYSRADRERSRSWRREIDSETSGHEQRRLGGQRQHSALLDMTPKSDRIETVLAHIGQNLRNALTIEELAAVANLSPRQFSRAFLAETRQSPARAVEQIRLEAARFMMEAGRHSAKVVAQETGFADRERMRRAFLRTFGAPAETLRRNARRVA